MVYDQKKTCDVFSRIFQFEKNCEFVLELPSGALIDPGFPTGLSPKSGNAAIRKIEINMRIKIN